MSPRFVDRDRKKLEIAIAAITVFSKGFETASIEDIAKAAGIGKGTVYEYFDSKKDIFQASVDIWLDRALSAIKKTVDDIDNPSVALKKFAETSITVFDPRDDETMGIFNTIQQQALSEKGIYYKNREKISQMARGGIAIVSDILLDGIAKGIFKPEIARDIDIISRNMLSYLDGIGLWSGLMPKNSFDYRKHVNHFFTFFLEIIEN